MKTTAKPLKLKPLTQRPAWKALAAHSKQVNNLHLRDLFAKDPKRGERFTTQAAGLFLDYSKNRFTDKTLKLLLQLAEESGLKSKIEAVFSGQKINITGNRAVLHIALLAPKEALISVGGKSVVPEVHAVLDKMADFCDRVRSGDGMRVRDLPTAQSPSSDGWRNTAGARPGTTGRFGNLRYGRLGSLRYHPGTQSIA